MNDVSFLVLTCHLTNTHWNVIFFQPEMNVKNSKEQTFLFLYSFSFNCLPILFLLSRLTFWFAFSVQLFFVFWKKRKLKLRKSIRNANQIDCRPTINRCAELHDDFILKCNKNKNKQSTAREIERERESDPWPNCLLMRKGDFDSNLNVSNAFKIKQIAFWLALLCFVFNVLTLFIVYASKLDNPTRFSSYFPFNCYDDFN